jgi:hypothetical protein
MSTFKFSVVQYVPDALRQERLNIGVVLASVDPPALEARFLTRREVSRLKSLGFEDDFSYIQDLAAEINSVSIGALGLNYGSHTWDLTAVTSAAKEWSNTIQFTELRAALGGEPQALLNQLFEKYVAAPKHRKEPKVRDKAWAKGLFSKNLRDTIRKRLPRHDLSAMVQLNHKARGKYGEHRFDYALHVGSPAYLIQVFSFDIRDRDQLGLEIDATAWAINDLRHGKYSLPIGVVAFGDSQKDLLESAERTYDSLGTTVVREGRIDDWLGALPFTASAS